jgi:hypothetical protein
MSSRYVVRKQSVRRAGAALIAGVAALVFVLAAPPSPPPLAPLDSSIDIGQIDQSNSQTAGTDATLLLARQQQELSRQQSEQFNATRGSRYGDPRVPALLVLGIFFAALLVTTQPTPGLAPVEDTVVVPFAEALSRTPARARATRASGAQHVAALSQRVRQGGDRVWAELHSP